MHSGHHSTREEAEAGGSDLVQGQCKVTCILKACSRNRVGGGKMAHQVKAFATSLDGLSSSSMTHTVEGENTPPSCLLTSICVHIYK